MSRYWVEAACALHCLRQDEEGMVSFEYVIVAACVVSAVGAAFTAATNPITDALTTAINTITGAVTAFVAG